MGRPTKNAGHPLVRLRKALSTPTQQMTRARFSKKVGIPESTLKAIESGKFKLSSRHAAQISSVTKVSPKCLMNPGMPLVDTAGGPIEEGFAANFSERFLDLRVLFEAALEVAEVKSKQAVFSFLFQRWLEETSEILGLRTPVTDRLLESYPLKCFGAIPRYFWPRDQKRREDLKKGVEQFEKDVSAKASELYLESIPGFPALAGKKFKYNPESFRTGIAKFAQDIKHQGAKSVFGDLATSLKRILKIHWDLRRKMIEEAKAAKPV
jgi:hypothetical protein